MASHGTCSPEPCKSAPRKPWRSFFKKDRFLCLSLHPSIPKPQGPFLKVFFPLWDFPLLPDPLSAPTLWSLQEPPTFQSLQLQLPLASRSFSLPQTPVDLQVGSGTRGQQNKGTGAPQSGARHPFCSLFWAREEGLSWARTPSPSPGLFPEESNRRMRGRWGWPLQQTNRETPEELACVAVVADGLHVLGSVISSAV